MAFTQAPVNDTHNVKRLDFAGQSFLVSNTLEEEQPVTLNYLNCFPLTEKQWNGEPHATVQKREAWLQADAASGTTTSSGSFLPRMLVMAPDVANFQNVFFPKYSNYYMFNYSTKALTSVTTSTTVGAAQYASGTDAVDSTNARRIAFLDSSSELKTFLQDGTSVTTTSLAAINADGTRGLVFLNSYLFCVDTTGYKIYNSTVGGNLTTWATTDFISAEQYADPILYLDKHKNYLVAFGSASIEFFYDGGIEVGSPLVRQENYSRQIGVYIDRNDGTWPGKVTCHIDDDIYFLGVRPNDSVGLFRIRNFQIEEIESQYFQNVANFSDADPKLDVTRGVETIIVNNNPMVLINCYNLNYSLVYFPKEDTWWMLSQGDTTTDFPEPRYRIGSHFFSPNRGFGMFLSQDSAGSTVLHYSRPDVTHSLSVTATVYTQVVDFGINYYKHIARVDAIGDFGNNTLTLAINGTPNYLQSFTTCSPTRTPSTDGFGNNASWYNLGGYRRFSFSLTVAGYSHAVIDGLDIEYNVGAA